MDAPTQERASERPPSPSAPERGRSPMRTRAMAGAAALTLGLATFLGPAAADELTGGGEATEEVDASETSTTEATAVEAEATSATEPGWTEEELAFFQELHDQRLAAFYEAAHRQQVEAFLEAAARQEAEQAEAARAERERVEREQAEQAEREQAEQAEREQAEQAEREQAQQAPEASAPAGGPWDALAQCESGGNWSINTGNGYYGGLQFSLQTWRAYGGQGMPHENSKGAQIAVAQRIQAGQGWGAWPSCSRQVGLR